MDALAVAREAAALSAASRWAELLDFLRARVPDAERVASTELAYRTGEAVFPPIDVVTPWRSIALLVAVVAGLAVAVTVTVVVQAVALDDDRSRIGEIE